MKSIHTLFSVILGALILTVSFSTQSADINQLPKTVQKIFKNYKLPEESLSLYIKEIGERQPLITLNDDVPRNPASSIKLLTTFAALELLGPTYTWQTSFYLDGTLTDGTLDGNLIMQGGGDPFLVSEAFWHILFTLQAKDLKHIKGDFLIDDAVFEDESGSPGDFDKKPYRAYNVFPDAALVNFQAHYFNFVPQKNGLHIYADPPAATMKIINKVKLSKGRCRGKYRHLKHNITRQGDNTVVTFSGDYPVSCGDQHLLRTMIPNDQYVFGVFKSLWENMGGTITGTVGKTKINGEKPFYVATSRPLSEIVTYINKYSNNVMARQLLLTLGKEKLASKDKESEGSKTLGRQAIKEWLVSIGIPAPELVLDNGSGLSRKARVSVTTMGKLLEHAYNSPYQPEFMASLPMLGIDGTLRKRLNGNIPAGKIRIKTGLLNNVRAMAGYVHSASGKRYVVVALQNHSGIQNGIGTQVQDEVLKWLYKQ
jgi:D-alanyl-D-alanine carboxypeptidase/D-alanyl-D-alanine-endopeptidase (penicillin-binding protein 4)